MKTGDFIQIRLASLLMFVGIASLLFIQAAMAARQATEGAAIPGKARAQEEILSQQRKLTAYGLPPYQEALATFELTYDILNITGHNLEPGVYSVRLTRENEYLRIASETGQDPTFTADDNGNATFSAQIRRIDLQGWDTIEVVQHIDEDPENTAADNLETVFETDVDDLTRP
jgi:hypothetical protein